MLSNDSLLMNIPYTANNVVFIVQTEAFHMSKFLKLKEFIMNFIKYRVLY